MRIYANAGVGPLLGLVLDLSANEHVFKIYLERSANAHHVDHYSICICLILVPFVSIPIHGISMVTKKRASS